MPQVSRNNQNLILENVTVVHNYKDDTLCLPTTDKDLKGKPFRIILSQGTETEQALRNLMRQRGLVSDEYMLALPAPRSLTESERNPQFF